MDEECLLEAKISKKEILKETMGAQRVCIQKGESLSSGLRYAQAGGEAKSVVEEEKENVKIQIVSTDGSKVSTDRQKDSTDEQNEGTDEQNEGTDDKIEGTDKQSKEKGLAEEEAYNEALYKKIMDDITARIEVLDFLLRSF
ncbi:hypothetical protein Tco_0566117 [Tanacetum coccineum]